MPSYSWDAFTFKGRGFYEVYIIGGQISWGTSLNSAYQNIERMNE